MNKFRASLKLAMTLMLVLFAIVTAFVSGPAMAQTPDSGGYIDYSSGNGERFCVFHNRSAPFSVQTFVYCSFGYDNAASGFFPTSAVAPGANLLLYRLQAINNVLVPVPHISVHIVEVTQFHVKVRFGDSSPTVYTLYRNPQLLLLKPNDRRG